MHTVIALVLVGYPPKGLSLHDTKACLTELGIRSGDTLIVEEQSPQAETHPLLHEKNPAPKITRRFVYTMAHE